MSLLPFLTRQPPKKPPSQFPELPDPNLLNNSKEIEIVNTHVQLAILGNTKVGKKRGNYSKNSDEDRAKIAKYAAENGDTAAARKFSVDREKPISVSSIQRWRQEYVKLQKRSSELVVSLPQKEQGRPTLLPREVDEKVRNYVKQLSDVGGCLSRTIVVAASKSFMMQQHKHQLKEFGGSLEIDSTLAQSILRRLNFVKRKGTKAARKLPENFEAVKVDFLAKICNAVAENNIPFDLVINFDQTAIGIVPHSDWTMAERGSKQVDLIAKDDKRQITALLAISLNGELLPPQLIYEGKTDACHPSANFPVDWDIFHTESHWSNEDSMIRFAEKVLVPWFAKKREEIGMLRDQKVLAIFDVFAPHRSKKFTDILAKNNIIYIYVPGNCTSELQPLDAEGGVNCSLKKTVKDSFAFWYAEELMKFLSLQNELSAFAVDLRLSRVKPLHANWFLRAFEQLQKKESVLMIGWRKTGILNALCNS